MITEGTIRQAVKNVDKKRGSNISFLSKLFCSHDYHLLNQIEMQSEFDIVVEAGYKPNTYCSQKRKIITDYKCATCGKVKRLTAETAD